MVRFDARDAGVLRPEDVDGEEVYETPIDEFRLSRFAAAPGAAPRLLPSRTPQVLLCTGGAVELRGVGGETGAGAETAAAAAAGAGAGLTLTPGESVFVPAGERITLSGDGMLFRATVVA